MLYEDSEGNILIPDEVDELSPFEIEERCIHVLDEDSHWLNMITNLSESLASNDLVTEDTEQIMGTMTAKAGLHYIGSSPSLIIGRQKGHIKQ